MPTTMSVDARRLLLEVFQHGLAAVHGTHSVSAALHDRAGEDIPRVVAIGKAAAAMAQGALAALGDAVTTGLVITKYGHLFAPAWPPGFTCLEAGHPLPDENSLAAGGRLLRFLADNAQTGEWLFLLSGGASSLVEVPASGIGLAELRAANDWLLASGLPVGQVNQVRKRLSVIKGGGLLRYLPPGKVSALLISDVPDNRVADIGSGLLWADATDIALPVLPAWLDKLVARADRGHDAQAQTGRRIPHRIVASNRDCLAAMAGAAKARGMSVIQTGEPLAGDTLQTGRRLAAQLKQAAPGLYLWGGETSMHLPPNPGRGGRNQALALAVAGGIASREDLLVLAAGTDGTDGVTADAGALVDGATAARGVVAGLDLNDCLRHADAGRFLEASGDLVHTGPTGTNVMDVVIALKA